MKSVTFIAGCIPGGRAGTGFQSVKIKFPLDAKLWKKVFDEEDDLPAELEEQVAKLVNFAPNSGKDIPKIIEALKSKKTWAGCDVYGEGVVGFGFKESAVKMAVMEDFLGDGGW